MNSGICSRPMRARCGCNASIFARRVSSALRSRLNPSQLARKVLLHGHCHHKALMKMNDEEALLRRMGVELSPQTLGAAGWRDHLDF